MTDVLARWNGLAAAEAAAEILPCCGSQAWAKGVAARRPILTDAELLIASDTVWRGLSEGDWLEAFRSHPRIGESRAPQAAHGKSAAWSAGEQQKAAGADDAGKMALAEGNREYERKFGRTFIICATGKSAPEILTILKRRLENDERLELHEAAEQQRQITQIRLRKWLNESS